MASKVAYTMKLKPGMADEYKRRHDEVWPEVLEVIRKHGCSDYSIFLDETSLTLFGVYKIPSDVATFNKALSEEPVIQRWWTDMAQLVEFNEQEKPITNQLKMVFHMN